jgi:acetoin utilization deacetylase AcuC-like enzyme
MNVSAAAMMERDRVVFEKCRAAQVPVCMLLSGGYSADSASAVGQSLAGLIKQECRHANDGTPD